MPNKFISREEYLDKQRQAIIEQSLENSRNRTLPTTPYVINSLSEKEWENAILGELKFKENQLKQLPPFLISDKEIKTKTFLENRIIELKNELSNGYKSCIPGSTCIYTATDNFGKKYRVSGNQTFRANPAKYGFEEINLNDIKPGDIIQDFGLYGPRHALTFVGYDDTNKALFNYSKGGSTESEIVKNGYYPFEWDDTQPTVHLDGINNSKLQHAAAAYRFIGTEDDNKVWNENYNKERSDWTKQRIIGVKDAPIFVLPNQADKMNFGGMKENKQLESTKQSKDFLFRWYNNPTTRAIMNEAFPFEKVEPYYNHEGKEFKGESAVRGHIANAIYHTPEYIEKLEDNVGGRYVHDLRNPHIIYNEHYIYNNDKVDPRIATHELTHALQYALPQNTLRTSKPVKQELKKGVVPDEYLDSMTEIGARINSFRNALSLTPEKRDYSPEDAEILMNTYIERFGEDATNKLNRFTPETLAGYLNYLAYNDKTLPVEYNNSDIRTARFGGKFMKGGVAIPLDNKNKLFYLSGAKHEQGGIDITPELEAEGGEVVKINPKSIKVVTAQKIMGGKSPAELVVDASSTGKSEKVFNKVFNYQEDFKDRYNLNDDGTKKAKWGIIEKIKNSNVGKQILDHLKFETFFNNEDYDSNIISINDRVTEGEYDLYPISKNSRYNKNNFYKKNDEIVYDSNGDSKSDYMQYKGYEPLNYDELRKMLPKRDYIGGSKRDVGIKVINKVPGLKDEILRLSEAYGISPNVFTQRLVNEGWVQDQAKFYNMASAKNQKNYRWDRMNDFVDGFNTLGLDTFGDHHKAGHLNLRRDIKYDDHFTTNEDDSGRVYNSADFDNMYDALEAKAAMLEYLTKLGKEKGHTGKDLDYWVNAAYNMGEYHKDLNNMDYVKKQYSFTPYYRFGGNMKKQYKLGGNTNLSFIKDKKKAKLGAADWVNISVNSAGALTNLITGLTSPDIRYARMKDPIPVTAPKINANVNITAEENAIDEEYYNDLKAINENTADSKVALNRIRNAGAKRAASKVKIRSNAENIARDLINKGNILAGEYQKYNIGRQDQVDAYNAQAEAAEFNANKDKVGDAISGFVGDLMQGTSTITNTLEKREADRNNAILTTLGYPEINPKTLDQTRRDLYKQMYLQDDIDRLKNRKTKIQNKSKWKEDRKNRVIGRIDKRINKLENF